MTTLLRLFSLTVFFCAGPAFSVNYIVQIETDEPRALSNHLEKQGIDVLGHSIEKDTVEIVASDLMRLDAIRKGFQERLGLEFAVVGANKSQPLRELMGKELIDSIEDYYDPEKVLSVLQEYEATFPNWAKVYDLNEWLGLEKTAEGNSLYALQVSRFPGVIEDEPKVAVAAQHHAREVVTHHAVIDAAKDLLERVQAQEAQAVAWVEGAAIWFVPVVNPDGLAHVFEVDRSWRKNRSLNLGGSRGVDLNRNYEFMWGRCGANSAEETNSVFKGPSAASEPEVRVMDQLNAKLGFQYLVSYHSYGNEVLYPYLCGQLAESGVYYGLRDGLASELGYRTRTASSSGEDFEHHYARYGTFSFLIEVGNSFQPSFDTYKNEIWPVVQKTLPFLLEQLSQSTVHIRVKDQNTGEPLAATVEIAQIHFQEGEQRTADSFGSYRWRLLPGDYSLIVSHDGYGSETLAVTATGGMDTYDVGLTQLPLNAFVTLSRFFPFFSAWL